MRIYGFYKERKKLRSISQKFLDHSEKESFNSEILMRQLFRATTLAFKSTDLKVFSTQHSRVVIVHLNASLKKIDPA